ncbi:pectate lyase family protein [Streptomyces lonarensis]|uniref:Pectate lyase n=1 Tax=Streptomyces lonarensis TaxID=700599 RepID=A0A7X6I0G8_9ACTN|nr:pectate lyase [Streptomyces lonarensis]NJQ07646.1 pectate lyase [Streptomyces lonarensis]
MRSRSKLLVGACAAVVLAGAVPAVTAAAPSGTAASAATAKGPARGTDLGHETLGPRDGWGAYGAGTSGGASAAPQDVHTVTDRESLLAALGDVADDTPSIIYVKGTIDMNVDSRGAALTCDDFADPGYDLDSYLDAYDPETWGWDEEPSGPLEEARDRSYRNQSAHSVYSIPSNTTLVGLGKDARVLGGAMYVRGVSNVIIRNISFEAVEDCFPQWDPTDGQQGNWNSEYDAIWLHSSTNVWLDHNTYRGGGRPDTEHFGRPYMVYDGSVDITRGSDLVTVSYNHYVDYDKGMLVGGGDSHPEDPGKLRVTYHHNLFENVLQRSPRVRRGEVHVYNNVYTVNDRAAYPFEYAWGVGLESSIHAANNYFEGDIRPGTIARRFNGTDLHETGTYLNGFGKRHQVEVVAEHNALRPDGPLGTDVGWTPWLYEKIEPVAKATRDVQRNAGAGNLR